MYCSHDIKNCGTGILYEQYDQMFINSDFENIIQECDSILEQNPDKGIFYWFRLLASFKCQNEHQILYSPTNPFITNDYKNALQFSEMFEIEALKNLEKSYQEISCRVIDAVLENKKAEHIEAKINDLEKYKKELSDCLEKLNILMQDVGTLEKQIKEAVAKRNQYIMEFQTKVQKNLKKLYSMCDEVSKISEIDNTSFQSYDAQVSEILQTTESNYNDIKNKSEDVEHINSLNKKKYEIVRKINLIIGYINDITDEIDMITENNKTVIQKYAEILDECKKGNFALAYNLLGKEIYKDIISKCICNI